MSHRNQVTASQRRRRGRIHTCPQPVKTLTVLGPTQIVLRINAPHATTHPHSVDTSPSQIRFHVSGAPIDAATIGVVNRMDTTLITSQPIGMPANGVRENVDALGIKTLVAEAWEADAGVEVEIMRTSQHRIDRFRQYGPELTVADMDMVMREAIQQAHTIVFIGGPSSPGAVDLLEWVVRVSPGAFVVLVADATLVATAAERKLLAACGFIYMRAADAIGLPGATMDFTKNALRLRKLAEPAECGLENDRSSGLVWIANRWVTVPPAPVGSSDGLRSAATFACALAVARQLNVKPTDAVRYAVESVRYSMIHDRRTLGKPVDSVIPPSQSD
ncbi:MAG: hypothetical protein SFY96_12605 [Planctomycetota bacterium]|nr:hypothetical protein [Planctomycetota bacterium]